MAIRGDHGAPAEERREENEAGRVEVEFSHRPKFGKEGALDHEQLPYRGEGGGGGGVQPVAIRGAIRGALLGNQWQLP